MKESVWTSPTFAIANKQCHRGLVSNFHKFTNGKNWYGKYKYVTKKYLLMLLYNFWFDDKSKILDYVTIKNMSIFFYMLSYKHHIYFNLIKLNKVSWDNWIH